MKFRRLATGFLAAVLLASSALAASYGSQGNDADWRAGTNPAQGEYVENLSYRQYANLKETTVIKDATSPTGFYVTFRYFDPGAERVRIRGEWSLYRQVSNSLFLDGWYSPADWADGMFPLQADVADWPAFEMTKDESTGIWSYTIPLPSGTWSYRFYVDGDEGTDVTDYTGAYQTTDPNNRPFEKELGEQGNSQVRVPFDGEKQTEDFSVQLPRSDGKTGTVEVLTYVTTGIEKLADDPALAVYLPYGYDADRAEPYPVLYISHGGGLESETSWYNKGSLGYITDNLIAEGLLEPTVVVSINNYATDFNVESFIHDAVPLVEATYNVATDPANKAVCGLSRGGMFTTQLMLNYPDEFGTFGVFSGAFADPTMEAAYPASLADASVYLAAGYFDTAFADISNVMGLLEEQGIAYESLFTKGGHDWNSWRQMYVDFVSNFLWK